MTTHFQTPVTTEPRSVLASFESYPQAQRLVDALSDAKLPLVGVTISGSDLRLVEAVTGRMTVWRAALVGAAAGAWWGLFVGVLVALFTPAFFTVVLWAVLIGVVFGAVFWAIAHALTGGRRDFASVQGITANRYDVIVPVDLVDRARQVMTSRSSEPPPAEGTPVL